MEQRLTILNFVCRKASESQDGTIERVKRSIFSTWFNFSYTNTSFIEENI
jgi:hypothetical protein